MLSKVLKTRQQQEEALKKEIDKLRVRFREAREALGWTLRRAGKKVQLSHEAISKFEHGELDLNEHLLRLESLTEFMEHLAEQEAKASFNAVGRGGLVAV